MIKILSFQLSAFVNKTLLAQQDRIMELMNELTKEIGEPMLPTVIDNPNLNIETGVLENIPNMAFSTVDKKYQIGLILDRIDCNCSFNNTSDVASMKEPLNKCAAILKNILTKYDIHANRLALNVDYTSEVCNGKTKFEREIIKSIPYYTDIDFNEWNSRSNKRESIKLHENDDTLNVITDFSRRINRLNGEVRIACHNDINTIGENGVFRFDSSSIEEFKDISYELFNKLSEEVKEWTEE